MNHAAWELTYRAFLSSALSRVAFHRTRLSAFVQPGERCPCLYTLYRRFREFDRQRTPTPEKSVVPTNETMEAVSAVAPVVRQVGANMQVVELDALPQLQVDAATTVRTIRPPQPRRTFRMRLPTGTSVEFESDDPESLALRMLLLSGGVA